MKALVVLTAAILLAGCASAPKPAKWYEGTAKPLTEIARVRMPNVRIFVVAVDGKSTQDLVHGFLDKSELQLAPGSHEFTLAHTRNEGAMSHDRAEGKLSAVVEAGHFYTVVYRDVDKEKVQFFLKDHGSTYDAKCSRLLAELSINIYMGKGVSAECY